MLSIRPAKWSKEERRYRFNVEWQNKMCKNVFSPFSEWGQEDQTSIHVKGFELDEKFPSANKLRIAHFQSGGRIVLRETLFVFSVGE